MILKQAVDAQKKIDPEKEIGFWMMLFDHHTERMKGLEHDPVGYRYHEKQAEHAQIMIERIRLKKAGEVT